MALTVLGLSGALTHDPSAALYIDGKLVAAAEETGESEVGGAKAGGESGRTCIVGDQTGACDGLGNHVGSIDVKGTASTEGDFGEARHAVRGTRTDGAAVSGHSWF